jgi:hypothetical protein
LFQTVYSGQQVLYQAFVGILALVDYDTVALGFVDDVLKWDLFFGEFVDYFNIYFVKRGKGFYLFGDTWVRSASISRRLRSSMWIWAATSFWEIPWMSLMVLSAFPKFIDGVFLCKEKGLADFLPILAVIIPLFSKNRPFLQV